MGQALPYEIYDDFLNMNLENISKGQFRIVFGLKSLQFVKIDFLNSDIGADEEFKENETED